MPYDISSFYSGYEAALKDVAERAEEKDNSLYEVVQEIVEELREEVLGDG